MVRTKPTIKPSPVLEKSIKDYLELEEVIMNHLGYRCRHNVNLIITMVISLLVGFILGIIYSHHF